MVAITLLGLVVALVFLLPLCSDALSLIRAARRRHRVNGDPGQPLPRLLFLVPAHNEEAFLGPCLESLCNLSYPSELFRVAVVADNCTDRTSQVARQYPVLCLERDDPRAPGKPHALAWAIGHFSLDEYDAVVIVDADSVADPLFARGLSAKRPLADKAVGPWCDTANVADTALTRMSGLLSRIYCTWTYPLKERAGLNVPLIGCGMCVGTAVLRKYGWQAWSIVEDVEIYVQLTLAGVKTEFAPEARISTHEARTLREARVQRERWRAGRLHLFLQYFRRILLCPRVSIHQKLDLIAELLVPGPAVHLAWAGAFACAAWLLPVPAGAEIIGALVLGLVRPVVYTVLAIAEDPRPWQTAKAFLFLPVYAVWRLGIELRSLIATLYPSQAWIRSPRALRARKVRRHT